MPRIAVLLPAQALGRGEGGARAAVAAASTAAPARAFGASAGGGGDGGGPSSSGSSSEGHEFIGAYTPITKRLWAQRLHWHTGAAGPGGGAAAGAAEAGGGAARPRAPEVTSVTYPFTRDSALLEAYANPWRGVRVGRLLEDLDSLAGSVALRHCAAPGVPPPHLVTAGIDAIHLRRRARPARGRPGSFLFCSGLSGVVGRFWPLSLDRDLELAGRVVWTGRSSLDIRITATQAGPYRADDPSLVAVFSFVSLQDGKPRAVPPLAPDTEEEKAWAGQRQAVADARKAARAAAAGGAAGAALPAAVAGHLAELVAAAGVVRDLPALASPHDMLMSQPQQRNPYGRVFGGFLLRRAFELAFATCYVFAGSRPVFDSIDDVQFKKPVDVGDLMRLASCVLHAEGDKVVVLVEASVVAPERLASSPTNAFTFAFRAAPSGAQSRLRRALPGDAGDLERLRQHWADAAL
ncbi:acyl-coenzyme A thioesterase, mitochondrial [Raphidocelis subcapitata]|uniref:Acyl-coenzyme A thioesterase, mitochondrial n=1 Tax=Raphidocelis subcapitata TaxID=307507 RepID=A0A2V0NPA4_9CHLO|nr:acyl-coenzyme A thioesterase, mitochondrial [Raphidocelis subcapitata]|eukprot:GBF87343.1 acyl-coenzyme A thioesterase, mitochondrial [Raphidocelis subcapitata]